ncbi:PRD domain-containing protein [Streptococcus infantarius]|uniref:PRD domain-containing protein n=1 Tax=Streptococcus infantarius TaxID=102684 RepID=UPI0022836FC0|nr:PRD domain-containing protein [Streptococcus infantarius]MDV2594339.1 PRD domain-containing protein [Streptococcus infantarius]
MNDVTLTAHIYCAYQSIQAGNYQSSKLSDVSNEYPIEYQIGEEALSIFKSKLFDGFPEDELGRIAIHFINAKREGEVTPSFQISRTKHILELVKQELSRDNIERTPQNSNFYDRFMVHLSYFLDYIDRSRKDNTSLLGMEEHLEVSYPKAFEIGNRIYNVIARETEVDLFHSERIYIVLHV